MQLLSALLLPTLLFPLPATATHPRPGSPNCNATPTPLPRSATLCGAVGHVSLTSSLLGTCALANTVNACYDKCLRDARCASFGFDVKRKTCSIFGDKVEKLGFRPQSGGNEFWDLEGCFDLRCLKQRSASSTALGSPTKRASSAATATRRGSATATPTATPACANLVKNAGFDDPTGDPWNIGLFTDDAKNAVSPSKYASFVVSNYTQSVSVRAACFQAIAGLNTSATYSGHVWVKMPRFNPQPPNADYSPCYVGAYLDQATLFRQTLYAQLWATWTKIEFQGIKSTNTSPYVTPSLIFGMDCDVGYVGPGAVEVWYDSWFIGAC